MDLSFVWSTEGVVSDCVHPTCGLWVTVLACCPPDMLYQGMPCVVGMDIPHAHLSCQVSMTQQNNCSHHNGKAAALKMRK